MRGYSAFFGILFFGMVFTINAGSVQAKSVTVKTLDLSDVSPDLTIPELQSGDPSPGKRVRAVTNGYQKTDVHHVLYLPKNRVKGKKYPVIVEWAGNGNFKGRFGEISTGKVEGSKMGYGLSGGKDFIWICMPYLSGDGKSNVITWWGSPPEYNPLPTLDYCEKTVAEVCKKYGGDPRRVVLAGFSRGSIAVNYLGLYNDRIAKLWCGMIAFSHYDGLINRWPYPGDDTKSALERIKRLAGRPQLICYQYGYNNDHDRCSVKKYLEENKVEGDFQYVATGYRNHDDAWTLRPGSGRTDAREWLKKVCNIDAAAPVSAGELGFDKIVFVKRNTCTSDHYYTDHVNDQSKPGGNLCVLNVADGAVTELVPEISGGWFGRFDISFDAKKIVFGWKKSAKEGYRIYEIDVDPLTGHRATSELRQLTFPLKNEAKLVRKYNRKRKYQIGSSPMVNVWYHHGTDDMHPCYLPDGGIVFSSTRCQYGVLCNNDDMFSTMILYRMDADGKGMRKLSNSALSESSPSVMSDGRILYTRWEYVDKGHIGAKCLWAMKPDGTGSVEIYGNDITYPPTFIYGRPIPDKSNEFVFLGTPHCFPNSIGTVIRVDTDKNIRTREPMTYMTPQVDIRTEKGFWYRDSSGQWIHDFNGTGPLFKDPYPLSDKLFLVAYKPAGPAWDDARAYGLYLLDEAGGVRLIHDEPDFSCWEPYPLGVREKPPVLSSAVDPTLAEKNEAVCVVTDVYHGLENVDRGSIKYIRILEQVARPWSARRRDSSDVFGKAHVALAQHTVIGLKVQWGIVPVEEDGSANFVVPANRNIYLQVLDENFVAVQSERTYVNYQPGEVRSCIGCHETPNSAPAGVGRMNVMALKRAPSIAAAQPGDTSARRTLHYPADVQPILDRHCVKCHNPEKMAGKMDLTGAPTKLFSVSYESLLSRLDKQFAKTKEGAKPTVEYLPARACFSYNTPLVAMLSKGKIRLSDKGLAKRAVELAEKHKEVDLSGAELLKISNWLDANCQYYGSYWGRRNIKFKGKSDFRPDVTFEEAISSSYGGK